MCNLYEFDEVDFIIKMRWALLKRQQVDYSCGSEIVSLINIESCKQAITCAFENYPPTVTKMVLESSNFAYRRTLQDPDQDPERLQDRFCVCVETDGGPLQGTQSREACCIYCQAVRGA
jgi:hypothetical protein